MECNRLKHRNRLRYIDVNRPRLRDMTNEIDMNSGREVETRGQSEMSRET